MSYNQFFVEVKLQSSSEKPESRFPMGHCVQQLVVDGEEVRSCTPTDLPEHREDEAYPMDPTFDNGPDTFLPSPADVPVYDDWGMRITTGATRRIDFEDLYKLSGRVIGAHEAIVRTPWFLTSQYISKKLSCTSSQAAELADAWSILDATESMVLDFIVQSKEMGVEVSMTYFSQLAVAAGEAESADCDDVMEQANLESFNESNACSSSESECLQEDYEANEGEMSDLDDWLSRNGEANEGVDISSLKTEGWHLMDSVDDDAGNPTWIDLQPSQVQVLYHQAEQAKSLSELKALGQKVYALASWNQAQRSAFWAVWRARRNAMLLQTEVRIKRVRQAVAKIRKANGTEVPQLGKRLFTFAKSNPGFYPEEGWAKIWEVYNEAKAAGKVTLKASRKQLVEQWLKAKAA